ncbi:MAG: winged helix DNA-binding domain-containing protein [Acidimicrobiia bacterium]
MRSITTEERRARLAVRHHLAAPAENVAQAAGDMVGLHSSDPATVYLSARARIPGLEQGDVEAALYDQRSVVRILGMRRTLFVVPAGDAAIIHHSSTLALIPAQLRRTAGMIESAGLATEGAAWVSEVSQRVMDALRRRGEATATELTQDVPELGEKLVFYKRDGSVMGTSGVSTRILFLLALEGKVVRGRPKGTWVSSLYRWAPLEDWMGRPMAEMGREEAQAALLTRWLRAFGPATEVDMKWWTGWPVTQVRTALENIGAVEVRLSAGVGHVLDDDVEPVSAPGPWVSLLPSLDPTPMGWKQRDWYLGPHHPRLFDRNGNAGPTIWVEGRIVGGWSQRSDGEIVWELLEDVGSETLAEIAGQAARLEEWLGDKVVIPRFRSVSDLELAGGSKSLA